MGIGERIVSFIKAIIKTLTLSSVTFLLSLPVVATAGESYSITMNLHVPRVYDNSNSLGYRKYQLQRIRGILEISDSGEATMALTNITHKVGGASVTYEVLVDTFMWNVVGNNLTGVFRTPSICISIEATPSYIKAYIPTDDDTLVLTMSGSGSSFRNIHGYAAGTLGCGCAWHGHKSPTRSVITGSVSDKASAWGSFTMRRRK